MTSRCSHTPLIWTAAPWSTSAAATARSSANCAQAGADAIGIDIDVQPAHRKDPDGRYLKGGAEKLPLERPVGRRGHDPAQPAPRAGPAQRVPGAARASCATWCSSPSRCPRATSSSCCVPSTTRPTSARSRRRRSSRAASSCARRSSTTSWCRSAGFDALTTGSSAPTPHVRNACRGAPAAAALQAGRFPDPDARGHPRPQREEAPARASRRLPPLLTESSPTT